MFSYLHCSDCRLRVLRTVLTRSFFWFFLFSMKIAATRNFFRFFLFSMKMAATHPTKPSLMFRRPKYSIEYSRLLPLHALNLSITELQNNLVAIECSKLLPLHASSLSIIELQNNLVAKFMS